MFSCGNKQNQSTDSTGGLIVSECIYMYVGWKNSPERGLKTVLFNP